MTLATQYFIKKYAIFYELLEEQDENGVGERKCGSGIIGTRSSRHSIAIQLRPRLSGKLARF
jgi:hypothetical protein